MDAFILKYVVDKLFDHLQEKRGVVLPAALWYISAGMFISFAGLIYEIIFLTPLPVSMGWNLLYVIIFAGIWSTHLFLHWRLMKEWESDADRFDNPDVRKKYDSRALFEREHLWFLRNFNLFFTAALLSLGLLTIDPSKGYLPSNTFDILFFASISVMAYAKCAFAKTPVRRTQTKLVPISIRSGS